MLGPHFPAAWLLKGELGAVWEGEHGWVAGLRHVTQAQGKAVGRAAVPSGLDNWCALLLAPRLLGRVPVFSPLW